MERRWTRRVVKGERGCRWTIILQVNHERHSHSRAWFLRSSSRCVFVPFPSDSGGVLSSVSNHGWHPVGGRLEELSLSGNSLWSDVLQRRQSSSTRPAGGVEDQNGDG